MSRTPRLMRSLAAILATGVTMAAPASAQVIYSENFNGGTPSNGSYATGVLIGGTTVKPLTGVNHIINQTPGDNMLSLAAGQYGAQSSMQAGGFFNLLAGFSYTLNFSQAVSNLGNGFTAGPWALAVNIGAGSTTFSGSGPIDWTAREFTYTPDSDITNALVNFVFFNPVQNPPGGYGYNAAFIDDITITAVRGAQEPPPTNVPEPSSVALLAAGLAGFTLIARKRRVT
ncbi:MAG: PEP-CTERM sorting domain-containing protein [Gemmatimonadaceae bacterium]|nr:PEP-CTERM sorting domain-containing protein [Gemmatimonadaceae bacterium]